MLLCSDLLSKIIMKPKEYKFKERFTVKPRSVSDGVVFAMGETHVCERNVFDLYEGKDFVETYETFDEAKRVGMEISSDND